MPKELSYNQLEDHIREINPQANFELIKRAYLYAEEAHREQKRKSGEPYIQHCLWTAWHLTDMRLDSTTISAGLLHDVVDDTEKTEEDIKKEFGKEIARLVQGITKLGKIKYKGIERHVENLRKMFLAMAEDIRTVLIKLADRLHNMETLSVLPPEKALRIALETLEIYAPIAYRLGIWEMKGRLEDLAFPFIYPKEYEWLIKTVKDKYDRRQKYLGRVKPLLAKELRRERIKPLEINYRAKHYFSLFKKLQRYEMNLNKVYDLVALRVIVENVEQCYTVLGIIHKLWKPLPGRIKDYIALPKPNGYQSLHTTVFCEEGKITEIQIRTKKMHEEAERGIAAHWYYKNKGGSDYKSQPKWIQEILNIQRQTENTNDFVNKVKLDVFQDRIFVFSPKGDVFDLPEDATPIDFAYLVHTEVGNKATGALVNDRMSPLDRPLKNGDLVDIVTEKNRKGPSVDWLKFVKTNRAKEKIRQATKPSSRFEQFKRIIPGMKK